MTKKSFALNSLLLLLIFPALIIIILTIAAIRFTSGIENEELKFIMEYIYEFGGSKSISTDTQIVYYLNNVKMYSHWIFTGCAMWIICILYVYEYKRRLKRENKKV